MVPVRGLRRTAQGQQTTRSRSSLNAAMKGSSTLTPGSAMARLLFPDASRTRAQGNMRLSCFDTVTSEKVPSLGRGDFAGRIHRRRERREQDIPQQGIAAAVEHESEIAHPDAQ